MASGINRTEEEGFGSPFPLASISNFSMLEPVSRPAGMTEERTRAVGCSVSAGCWS